MYYITKIILPHGFCGKSKNKFIMIRTITKLVGMTFVSMLFIVPLAAQSPAKAEIHTGRIEPKSVSLLDNDIIKPFVSLRADSKAWPEYEIVYTADGRANSKIVYEYNSAGNPISSTEYYMVGSELTNNFKTVYEYDAAENLTLTVSCVWRGGEWVNRYKSVDEYNSAGNHISSELYTWEDGAWVGNYKVDYEYTNGERRNSVNYIWENNGWIRSDSRLIRPFAERVDYLIEDDIFYFGYPLGIGNGRYYYYGFRYKDGATLQTEYDSKGNLTLFGYDGNIFEVKYNNDNNPVFIEYTDNGRLHSKLNYEYDNNGKCIFHERLSFNWSINEWVFTGHKTVNTYDTKGNKTSFEMYEVEMVGGSGKYVLKAKEEYRYDSNSNLIYKYTDSRTKYSYKYDNNGTLVVSYYHFIHEDEWTMSYTIRYPNTYTPDIKILNSESRGESDKGGILDVVTNITIDSIQSSSMVLNLPAGLVLDKAGTAIASDVTDKYDLKITEQSNGSYLLSINFKANKNINKAGKLLHLAFLLPDNFPLGTYNITVNNIKFTTPGGTEIPEPAITIPIEVTGEGVDNYIFNAVSSAYIINNTLYVNTSQREQITIYSINGSMVYDTAVSEGTTTIDVSAFPQGVLIVKSSGGWVKKIVKN